MNRKIFSITIMASSITMPTIRVSASMVIEFIDKPMAFISVKAETMEVGIARDAIKVVRQLARNIRITTDASMLPRTMWCWMFLMDAFVNTDWSEMTSAETSFGSVGMIAARRSFTSSELST